MIISIKIGKAIFKGIPSGVIGGELLEFEDNTIPEIGQEWPEQGGIRAGYMPPEDGQPGYSLILPTDPAAQASDLPWGRHGHSVEGLSARDGKANTDILAAGDHPAAKFCAELEIDGHKDFFLCSRREASVMAGSVPHLFEPGWHWTSTQYSANHAFVQDFEGGYQFNGYKGNEWRVRAVRRFIH